MSVHVVKLEVVGRLQWFPPTVAHHLSIEWGRGQPVVDLSMVELLGPMLSVVVGHMEAERDGGRLGNACGGK